MYLPSPLIHDIKKGRATLFLGAGASAEAGLPTASHLARFLSERAPEHAEKLVGLPLDLVAQYLYGAPGFGVAWVKSQIVEKLLKDSEELPPIPSRSHELMTQLRWRAIFTTNYDRLIESAYEAGTPVQRPLPFFKASEQVFRSDPNEVKIIKLNGSVDEARRNDQHKLVLTFSEQNDAYIDNEGFYRLLRQEAINGPIVFIGFRFVFPGAQAGGTSPELAELKALMQRMGSNARNHYCVVPASTDIGWEVAKRTLNAAKVEVLEGTFGSFMEAVLAQGATKEDVGQEEVYTSVPVGLGVLQIPRNERQKDRRHFDLLGSDLESLPPPSIEESLNGSSNWASFLHGHYLKRRRLEDLINLLAEDPADRARMLCIGAPAGWGKSFFVRSVAIRMFLERRPVIWLSPFGTIEEHSDDLARPVKRGSWDLVRLDSLLKEMATLEANRNHDAVTWRPVIVADNCAERAAEVMTLFRTLARNEHRFSLLFPLRSHEYHLLREQHPILSHSEYFDAVGTESARDEVEALIEFCANHGVAAFADNEKDVVAQRILSAGAHASMLLALQVIFDRQHRPFHEIVKETWDSLPDELAEDLITRVASLHSVGAAFAPRLFPVIQSFGDGESALAMERYRELLAKGTLSEIVLDDEPCIETRHALVAEHLLKVSELLPGQIDEERLFVVSNMTRQTPDLEQLRRLSKRINDYDPFITSDEGVKEFFEEAAQATAGDWVICQQYSKYLNRRREYEAALLWIGRAIEDNPDYGPLLHTKGNTMQRWGMDLMADGHRKQAQTHFDTARECFAISRISGEPDEYGYVTHLDMLLGVISNTHATESEQINARAEGHFLYREGLAAVPKDRYNLLLDRRFRDQFGLKDAETVELARAVTRAVSEGVASAEAATFLARYLYTKGNYSEALRILERQRASRPGKSAALWATEAELHLREGMLTEAARAVHSARHSLAVGGAPDVSWRVSYWGLLTMIALADYGEARHFIKGLKATGIFTKSYPRGYVWKESARQIEPSKRNFKVHARIWNGRIREVKSGGSYGRIQINNRLGEAFYIPFNPRYFKRSDFRQNDDIQFVITILGSGLRADDPSSQPFVNTVDDIFLPELR